VQRIVIRESIYDELKSRLVEDAHNLQMGDPRDERTFRRSETRRKNPN
jgi:acyl-CoA reductase-like NAD-dependent aldehyde dehydrogenase